MKLHMKKCIGFLIVLFNITIPVWASYEFKMKLFECNKKSIEEEQPIVNVVQTNIKSSVVSLQYLSTFNLFTFILDGGILYLKTYPQAKLVKVEISSKHPKSVSTFIESLVGHFSPSFYTFTDPSGNSDTIFKDYNSKN